jgi:hypothetical protein
MTTTANAPTASGLHVGDEVRTPLRRMAEIVGWLPDGRADLVYRDTTGGTVSLQAHLLVLVRRADE